MFLEPTSSVKRVKCTLFNFTWWPWKHSWFKEAEVRPKVWSRPHLRTHLTNKKWKPCARFKCTWSSSKILKNGGIQLVLQAFLLCQQVWSHAFYRATFPSALKSSSYLKLTSLLVWSQQLTLKQSAFFIYPGARTFCCWNHMALVITRNSKTL